MAAGRTGWIAGVNHGAHDASAVLLHEGRLVVWVEQERLSRTKHAIDEPPAEALRACLEFAGIGPADLDCIALGSDHDALARWLCLDAEQRRKVLPFDRPERILPADLLDGHPRPPTVCVRHHLAHAASAFYPSGFDRAAGLVMDAMGEDASTSLAVCQNKTLSLPVSYGVEESLGFFYEAAALYAGFSRLQTGKLMGLASYGTPGQPMPLEADRNQSGRLWTIRHNAQTRGRTGINNREADLLAFFGEQVFPHCQRETEEVMAYQDFAASAQASLEDAILTLAERAVSLAGSRDLTLSGGVALNCSANGVLSRSGLCDRLFVQPASTDSGVAYGAALVKARELYGTAFHPGEMRDAYWGLESTRAEIRSALDASGLPYRELAAPALCEAAADVIARDGILAWHQGRAEIGPRSLGARSLLGNPARRATLARINRIKQREVWRPLAPSVLDTHFSSYFDGTPNPFMIVSALVRPEMRRRIPAVTHVDGTARPQVVTLSANPRFHDLLTHLHRKTGTPVVINTSLNGPEEPICLRPAETIRLFQSTEIDALALGDFLVEKPHG